MDTLEVGAYCLLLFHSIDQEHPGYLPNDEESLMRISKLTEEQWNKCKRRLLKKFEHSDKGYYNKRMVKELKRQAEEIKAQQISDRVIGAINSDNNFKVIDKQEQIHPLQKYVSDNFHNVKRFPFQLTYEQCVALTDKYKFPTELIKNKLMDMEDTVDLYKKKYHVFYCLKNYCQRDFK